MKRCFLFLLAAAMLLSVCIFPASAAELREVTEEWDDFDNPNIQYFDYQGNQHTCDICGMADDSKDVLGCVSWFQGGHLKNRSGHFLHVGAYAVITVENCKNIQWWTQYRGPAGAGYSTSAEVYIDDVLVATLGSDVLNGENLTDPFMFWDSGELDGQTHVIKILNTAPLKEGVEEADWMNFSCRLPIDYFMVTYMTAEEEETAGTEYTPDTDPIEETTAAPTDAPSTDAPTSGKVTDKVEEKSGCGSVLAPGAFALAVALAAPVLLSRKKKQH